MKHKEYAEKTHREPLRSLRLKKIKPRLIKNTLLWVSIVIWVKMNWQQK